MWAKRNETFEYVVHMQLPKQALHAWWRDLGKIPHKGVHFLTLSLVSSISIRLLTFSRSDHLSFHNSRCSSNIDYLLTALKGAVSLLHLYLLHKTFVTKQILQKMWLKSISSNSAVTFSMQAVVYWFRWLHVLVEYLKWHPC